MPQLPLREIEGAKDLVQDAVEASVTAVADIQIVMTHRIYDLLALVPPIAAPVRAIEQVHLGLTRGVYTAVLAAHRLAGALADEVIEGLAEQKAVGQSERSTYEEWVKKGTYHPDVLP